MAAMVSTCRLLSHKWGSQVGMKPALSTPELGVFGPLHQFHCSLTVPMSHCEPYEYREENQSGLQQLQWSQHADF
eukprot:scaffold77300_cov40-Cyclotella_meneghiniana.AAC.1